MSKFFTFIKSNKLAVGIFLLGCVIRLLFAFFQTHNFDLFNILVITKSVADTGSILDGFLVIQRTLGLDVQLYGKIYYQIAGLWLLILDKLHLVNISLIFDTKPYDPASYMNGFLQWALPLHKLVLIKQIQFLFDFLLLFFAVKSLRYLGLQSKWSTILITFFWAFNPLFIFTSYAIFQADIAMVACLMASTYFVLKDTSRYESDGKSNIRDHFFAFFFLAAGAIIKQVPIIIFPVALLFLSRNIKDLVRNLFFFGISYVLLSQPWSADAAIVKRFFMYSAESLALFRFSLNSVPIFLIGYAGIFTSFFLNRKVITKTAYNYLLAICVLISLIYISEESGQLFIQFNSWILIFLALASIKEYTLSIFLFGAYFGFLKRAIEDNAVLSGSFGISLGSPLQLVPTYNNFFVIMNPIIRGYLLNFAVAFIYICLIIYILEMIFNKYTFRNAIIELLHPFKITFLRVVIAFFLLFTATYLTDYFLKSPHTLITSYNYSKTGNVTISQKPISFLIHNPEHKQIKGFDLPISRQGKSFNDFVTFDIYDAKTKQHLLRQDVNDLEFSGPDEIKSVFLTKSFNNETLLVQISDKYSLNRIVLQKGKIVEKIHDQGDLFSGYNYYYKKQKIYFSFPDAPLVVNVRGKYGLSDMYQNTLTNLMLKPKFYLAYFGGIVTLFMISIGLLLPETITFLRRRKLNHFQTSS